MSTSQDKNQYLCYFNFYQVTVKIVVYSELLKTRLLKDFSQFSCEPITSAHVQIEVDNYKPLSMPRNRRPFRYRGAKILDSGSVRTIEYNKNTWLSYDFKNEIGKLFSNDLNDQHEKLYLAIHSRVGYLLDLSGMHRIHCMGIIHEEQNVFMIGDSGIGKSSLAIDLMKKKSLLSDDTMLIKNGELFAFPIRVGLTKPNTDLGEAIELNREHYGMKYLYDLTDNYTKDLKERSSFFLVERGACRIKRSVSKYRKIIFLLKYLFIGIGTPQVLELFWEPGIQGHVNRFKIACSRLANVVSLMKERNFTYISSDSYEFTKKNIIDVIKNS